MQHEASHAPPTDLLARKLPPIAELTIGSMILVVVGGIYMAAKIPGNPNLAPAVGLLAVAALLIGTAVVMLSRLRDFAWHPFKLVFGWTLLAYVVIAGMIELSFVLDGTRGSPLLILTLMLVAFALDVPLLLGFSVARYQEVEPANR
jgi:hypothetical protein